MYGVSYFIHLYCHQNYPSVKPAYRLSFHLHLQQYLFSHPSSTFSYQFTISHFLIPISQAIFLFNHHHPYHYHHHNQHDNGQAGSFILCAVQPNIPDLFVGAPPTHSLWRTLFSLLDHKVTMVMVIMIRMMVMVMMMTRMIIMMVMFVHAYSFNLWEAIFTLFDDDDALEDDWMTDSSKILPQGVPSEGPRYIKHNYWLLDIDSITICTS